MSGIPTPPKLPSSVRLSEVEVSGTGELAGAGDRDVATGEGVGTVGRGGVGAVAGDGDGVGWVRGVVAGVEVLGGGFVAGGRVVGPGRSTGGRGIGSRFGPGGAVDCSSPRASARTGRSIATRTRRRRARRLIPTSREVGEIADIFWQASRAIHSWQSFTSWEAAYLS
jgi:hypothetical protein